VVTYAPGQLVRIRARLRADRAGYVDHVTRTQAILIDVLSMEGER